MSSSTLRKWEKEGRKLDGIKLFTTHSTHSCSFFCHLELKNWKIVVVWHFRVNNSAFFDDDDDSPTCR